MTGLIIGAVVMGFFALLGIGLSSKGKRAPLKNDPIPLHLGLQEEKALPIVQKLDQTLKAGYVDNVKNRVLQDHPKWKDHEFDWGMFELKRYFIMNSLLKSVPMFSHNVDEIWHQMLMFTRDYEDFSKKFYHEMLHHVPNTDSTPIPGERAFFDWVYLSLFESTPNSRAIWGQFLQNPIKREILDDFHSLSEEELLEKYFRNNDDWLDVKKHLITKLKNELRDAKQVHEGAKKFPSAPSSSEAHIYMYAASAAVMYSLYDDDDFQNHMGEVMPEEYYNKHDHSSGGSACSGFACGTGWGDSNDSGGGGDSGGSSCSSCGGGCGSS
ncbi:hypothetical protein FZW96_00175 [Bacillus sp. BGMRC 2118]|nr:hypothetical protein FZW96_00175 [Bacillus sp. BGMRC 2118]